MLMRAYIKTREWKIKIVYHLQAKLDNSQQQAGWMEYYPGNPNQLERV